MPKENLKDKLDGNELDLSLSNLVTVPVKELASLPKATVLDLSNNSIVQLPDEFCTLTHLVKLDLSKNSLTQLPERIGSLQKLQHLDLLGNLLTTLPVSVHHLKSLKWLDIKDNPLGPELKAIAGNCLDDVECRNCAKNVVAHFKTIESNLERERQKKLQEEREIEARLRAEEEKVRQRKKAEKQLEKEKRRKEYEQKQREMAQESKRQQEQPPDSRLQDGRGDEAVMKDVDERSCLSVVLKSLISLLFICVALYVFCEMNPTNSTCQEAHSQMRVFYVKAEKFLETLFEKVIPISD